MECGPVAVAFGAITLNYLFVLKTRMHSLRCQLIWKAGQRKAQGRKGAWEQSEQPSFGFPGGLAEQSCQDGTLL